MALCKKSLIYVNINCILNIELTYPGGKKTLKAVRINYLNVKQRTEDAGLYKR